MKISFSPKIATSFIIGTLFLLSGCYTDYQNPSEDNGYKSKRMELSEFRAVLPAGEGVELVQANCMTCHSVEYINNQPDLSEKAWEKIVDKMIKNFGAPVADSTARAAIIKYLINNKGKQ